ncbi:MULTISPECIES: T6SS immunity protein Tli3 family protein [unclassified Rahnella]|jgi:hypothetical protein|uniref:T6SS immunity protein Tli3 family protein n=1 Tax=unclassified Rahnella TaxID=2635087 RepID=UPI00101F0C2E|nr:hypothetical protein [Rahnella sp. RFA10(1/100)]
MKKINRFLVLASLLGISACVQSANNSSSPPTQVVYRFDDHRYLELTGFNCQGRLQYIDTKRNITTDIYDGYSGYRVYTKIYIHPSERYIVIPEYEDLSTFTISKDYGKTWERARYSPGAGADPYGKRIPARKTASGMEVVAGENTSPLYEDIISLTVVADQGFVLTKWGDIYMSSKPFDAYDPEGHGGKWGKEYASWNSFAGPERWTIDSDRKNFQDIPNKVPVVKNYTGWDKMRCNPDLGLPASEQGK